MKRALLLIFASLLVAIGLYALGSRLWGPGAAVAAIFDEYRSAQIAAAWQREADVVTDGVVTRMEALRKHALRSDRATVAALPFGERFGVFGLRLGVLRGQLTATDLAETDTKAGYLKARATLGRAQPDAARWILIAVLPTGPREAWGLVDPTGYSAGSWLAATMAVFGPFRFRFVKDDKGWRIDPLPLFNSSASENEYWATRMEPSGNDFIFKMFQVADTATVERLWQPVSP